MLTEANVEESGEQEDGDENGEEWFGGEHAGDEADHEREERDEKVTHPGDSPRGTQRLFLRERSIQTHLVCTGKNVYKYVTFLT